jgi:hypothetical protein
VTRVPLVVFVPAYLLAQIRDNIGFWGVPFLAGQFFAGMTNAATSLKAIDVEEYLGRNRTCFVKMDKRV